MALGKWVVILVVWTSSWTLNTADVNVSCVYMESCILPCSFPAGADVVIQWIQVTTGGTTVHSYYSNQDWFIHQDQRFRGRTFLFNTQISRGNASLRLTGVEVQDQGRYKCYTGTSTETQTSFINVLVDDDPKPNVAAIAGGVVGGVCLVLAVIGVAVFCICKRIKSRRPTETTPDRKQSNGQQEQIPLNDMKEDKDENDEETLKTEREPNEH